MILLIDNYDSFVYNLARYIKELGYDYLVKRNNEISLDEISFLSPTHIVISPGPCTPDEAGISLDLIKTLGHQIPILGVCLGHQAIGQAYGGLVVSAKNPTHGQASPITHNSQFIFKDLNNPLRVGRYHSLAVSKQNLPDDLRITATSEDGEIMGLQHVRYPVYGVQFHPESILSEQGKALLYNFITLHSEPNLPPKTISWVSDLSE